MLHRFCFKLAVPGNFDYEGNVYEENVFAALFVGNLPDAFQKCLTFDIANCTADFADYNIGSRLTCGGLLLG